jgi:hypothetical protein
MFFEILRPLCEESQDSLLEIEKPTEQRKTDPLKAHND